MSLTQIAQRDSVISAWIPRRIFDRTLRGKSLSLSLSLTFKSVTQLKPSVATSECALLIPRKVLIYLYRHRKMCLL